MSLRQFRKIKPLMYNSDVTRNCPLSSSTDQVTHDDTCYSCCGSHGCCHFPPSGSSCVAGSRGQLSGHGPSEQEHARVWTANPPGVTGECGAGVCCGWVQAVGDGREDAERENRERRKEFRKSFIVLNLAAFTEKPCHMSSVCQF